MPRIMVVTWGVMGFVVNMWAFAVIGGFLVGKIRELLLFYFARPAGASQWAE